VYTTKSCWDTKCPSRITTTTWYVRSDYRTETKITDSDYDWKYAGTGWGGGVGWPVVTCNTNGPTTTPPPPKP